MIVLGGGGGGAIGADWYPVDPDYLGAAMGPWDRDATTGESGWAWSGMAIDAVPDWVRSLGAIQAEVSRRSGAAPRSVGDDVAANDLRDGGAFRLVADPVQNGGAGGVTPTGASASM